MAEITIEIDDDQYDRVLHAFCMQNGYQEKVPNLDRQTESDPDMIPNPESMPEFMDRTLTGIVESTVHTYEVNHAADTARQSALENFKPIVTKKEEARAGLFRSKKKK